MRPLRSRHVRTVLVGAMVVLAACSAPDVLVTSERADQIPPASADPTTTSPDEPTPTDPDQPTPTFPPGTDPPTTEVTTTQPPDPVVVDPEAINFGDDKPPRFYDDFLLATRSDLEAWLTAEYLAAFGEEWVPLQGDVYAGYPERTDQIPGCGEPVTDYQDLQFFVAFYCPIGDFIVYDDGDGPDALLFPLAEEFGAATIGIVLAHEYGHAIQLRTGALDRGLATVVTEQQADCIAGAWAGRAASGQASGVPFTDEDVRAGLIAMITVQDPIGTDPLEAGGHGSGFDRVGAFQVGFQEGLARCAELIDDPLPLTPLRFLSQEDFESGGNAVFGYGETELFGFLVPDLNLLYDNDLDAEFPNFVPLTLVPTQSESEVACANPVGRYADGVVLCPETATVFLNEPEAFALYNEFGDFAPGYLLGVAWAEAAQISNGSTLTGEARELQNDCLTGAWVFTVTPDEDFLLPQPRDPGRTALVSPNDLTEAIQTAILIGDETASTNVLGSAFEKIDAFRRGTLGSITACV